MYQSMDNLNPQWDSDPRGQHVDPLDRLDAKLNELYSVLAGFAHNLQRFCANCNPILELLGEALSHADATTASSLPALLQAIGRGGRQEIQHCQSVHWLAVQQQVNVEQLLTNVSSVFASIGAAIVAALGNLLTVLQARVKLDRPPNGRDGVPGMKAVWHRAQDVSNHAGSLLLQLRECERSPGTDQLREELGRFGLLLAMSHKLADELMVLAA